MVNTAVRDRASRELTFETSSSFSVTVEFAISASEHRRRRSVPIGAVTSLAMLERVHAIGREWIDATPADQALARRAGPLFELSERRGRPARIRAVPRVVATPRSIELTSTSWARGFRAISRFAGLAARTLVLQQPPRDTELAVLECSWFGLGLAIETAEGRTSLVEPASFERDHFTPTAWLFGEQLYDHFLRSRSDRTSATL